MIRILFLLAFSLTLHFSYLPASSVNNTIEYSISAGKIGEPYLQDGVTWQDIFFEGEKFRVVASMPGSPKTVFSNGSLKLESDYLDTYYWAETSALSNEAPPKTFDAFIKMMGSHQEKFKQVNTDKERVRYALDYTYTDNEGHQGVTRIYVSKNKIYILGVVGTTLSCMDEFFDSFSIEKE